MEVIHLKNNTMTKRLGQITILYNYKVKFEKMCDYFNIKVKNLGTFGTHTAYEFKNEVLSHHNTTKEELMYFIKDIYEKALLEK